MPSTIGHIVAIHEIAQARRKAGQPIWDRTINIKEILHRDQDNTSDEHAIAVGREIAALIRSRVPKAWLDWPGNDCDQELTDIVEALEEVSGDGEGFSACEYLNGWLDQLYDWADFKRVWLW